MALIKIFKETDTNFNTDGDKVIEPIEAIVTEVQDGDYYLDLEVRKEDRKYIAGRCIVAAWYNGSWQGFRVQYEDSGIEEGSIRCWHVSYDAEDVLIKHIELDDVAFNTACKQILINTTDNTNITITTAKTVGVTLEIHYNNLYEIIKSLQENYTCHMVRDNFNFRLVNEQGKDNGVTVEYGKNLIALDKYESVENLVTKLYPTMVVNETEYTIDGEYVEDNLYGKKYVKHEEFSAMYPEYYQAVTEGISSLENEISSLNSENNKLQENKDTYTAERDDIASEIYTIKSKLSELQEFFKTKVEAASAYRTEIFGQLTKAMTKTAQKLNKNIQTYTSSVFTTGQKLGEKQDALKEANEKYKTYTKKKLKTEAEKAKKKVEALKKDVANLKQQVKNIDSKIKSAESQRDEIEKYLSKYNTEDKLKEKTIEEIMLLLKSHGISFCTNIAKEYAEATELDKNKEEYLEEIVETAENLTDAEEEWQIKTNEITATQTLIDNNNSTLDTAVAEVESMKKELEDAIKDDLMKQATWHLNKYKYPQVSYKVESLPVEAGIGDTVVVKNGLMGIDITAQVIKKTTNVLTGKVETLEFGNTEDDISAMRKKLQEEIDNEIAKTQIKLDTAYSNFLNKVSEVEGYIAGMQTQTIKGTETVETTTQFSIQRNLINQKVSEETAQEMITTEVQQTATEIRQEAQDTKEGLESSITQTAGTLRSEFAAADNKVKSQITQTANELRTDFEDADNNLQSSITQTASSLRTEFKNADSTLKSSITQTMNSIKSELEDADNDLQSSITQTASSLRTEFKNADSTLKSSITQTMNSIKSELEDADNDLQSSITQTASSLRTEFKNEDSKMQSQITQNANGLSSKVSKDGIISAINQSAESVTINAAKINLNGTVTANKTFKIDTNGNMKCTGGEIAGFSIDEFGIQNGDFNHWIQIHNEKNMADAISLESGTNYIYLNYSGDMQMSKSIKPYNHNTNMPYVQHGKTNVNVSAADTVMTANVNFGESFNTVPSVVATANTSVPNKVTVGVGNVTKTGFTIYLTRSTTSTTGVYWIAVGT